MVDAMRAMLDELMGKERNVPMEKRTNKSTRFDDSDVCKYALCGLCPYGLFKNTKSDLGKCKYEVHEDAIGWDDIQAQFTALSEREKDRYGYDRELLALLEQLVRDMDRKIDRQRERAEKESQPRDLTDADRARLEAVKSREKAALAESERLAEVGEIDASLAAAQSAESLKQQHDALFKTLTTSERSMTVCEICGVFINSTDNEQRRLIVQDHLTGKQYLGWKAIREKLVEMREAAATKAKQPPSEGRERERRVRERSRSRSRGDRERDRRRSRSPRARDRYREVGPPDSYRRREGHERDRHRERERDRRY